MSKLIAVSDEAYDKLKHLKNGESFSKAILRLIERPKTSPSVMAFAGIFKDKPAVIKAMEDAYSLRKKWKIRNVDF